MGLAIRAPNTHQELVVRVLEVHGNDLGALEGQGVYVAISHKGFRFFHEVKAMFGLVVWRRVQHEGKRSLHLERPVFFCCRPRQQCAAKLVVPSY